MINYKVKISRKYKKKKKSSKKKSSKKIVQYGGIIITQTEKKREDKKVSKILDKMKDSKKNITSRSINKELETLKPDSNKSLKSKIYHDVVDIFKKTKNKAELTIDQVLDKILKKYNKKEDNEKEKAKIKKIIKYTTIAVTTISAILTGIFLFKKSQLTDEEKQIKKAHRLLSDNIKFKSKLPGEEGLTSKKSMKKLLLESLPSAFDKDDNLKPRKKWLEEVL